MLIPGEKHHQDELLCTAAVQKAHLARYPVLQGLFVQAVGSPSYIKASSVWLYLKMGSLCWKVYAF